MKGPLHIIFSYPRKYSSGEAKQLYYTRCFITAEFISTEEYLVTTKKARGRELFFPLSHAMFFLSEYITSGEHCRSMFLTALIGHNVMFSSVHNSCWRLDTQSETYSATSQVKLIKDSDDVNSLQAQMLCNEQIQSSYIKVRHFRLTHLLYIILDTKIASI